MGILVALLLLLFAVILLLSVNRKLISNQTLQTWANVAGIIALIAAIFMFVMPEKRQGEEKPPIPPSIFQDCNVDLISTQVRQTKIGGTDESRKKIENLITNEIPKNLKSSCFRDGIKKGFNVIVIIFVNSEKGGYPKTVYIDVDQKDVDDDYINCLRQVFEGTLFPEPDGYTYEVKVKVRVVQTTQN